MIVKSKNVFSKTALPALAILLGLGLNSAQAMEPAEKDMHTVGTMVAKSVEDKDLQSYGEVSKGLQRIVLNECKERLLSKVRFGTFTLSDPLLGRNWIGVFMREAIAPNPINLHFQLWTANELEEEFRRIKAARQLALPANE